MSKTTHTPIQPTPSIPSTSSIPSGDRTSTARARVHLERLKKANGKRLIVDLDSETNEALSELLAAEYGGTNREVVARAIIEAAKRIRNVQ